MDICTLNRQLTEIMFAFEIKEDAPGSAWTVVRLNYVRRDHDGRIHLYTTRKDNGAPAEFRQIISSDFTNWVEVYPDPMTEDLCSSKETYFVRGLNTDTLN